MANIALQSAATGLSALNTKLDVIANNLANVNTNGFKASRANFQDLLYVGPTAPANQPQGTQAGTGTAVPGAGSRRM